MEDRAYDLSQADGRAGRNVSRIAVAATSAQRELLIVALDHYAATGEWPTAIGLSHAADFSFPDVCRELKIAARLGLVSWGKTVRVLRMPEGLFLPVVPADEKKFAPDTERALLGEMSRECAPHGCEVGGR